jgi:hypothetical protein
MRLRPKVNGHATGWPCRASLRRFPTGTKTPFRRLVESRSFSAAELEVGASRGLKKGGLTGLDWDGVRFG